MHLLFKVGVKFSGLPMAFEACCDLILADSGGEATSSL